MSVEQNKADYYKRWLFLTMVINDMKIELDSNKSLSNAVLARKNQLSRIIKAIEAEKTY